MTDLSIFDINGLILREGGDRYTNDPSDPGGPTKFGITAVILGEVRHLGRAATAAEVQALTQTDAESIYTQRFIIGPGLDHVADASSPALALRLFDIGVNGGTGTAAQFLQQALNAFNRGGQDWADIQVGGGIGPQTLGALQAFMRVRGPQGGARVLEVAVQCLEGARYISLAQGNQALETYEYGWFSSRVILGS